MRASLKHMNDRNHWYYQVLILLLSTWIYSSYNNDTDQSIIMMMIDGWTCPIQTNIRFRYLHHNTNPNESSSSIIRQQEYIYHPSRRVTDLVRLSLSSSINGNDDDDDDDTRPSPALIVTATTTTSISPQLKDILDMTSQSLLRIIQTMSMTVTTSPKQKTSDINEKKVQDIVQDILQICDDYDQIITMERDIEISKRNTETNDWMEQFRSSSKKLQEQMVQSLYTSTIQLQKSSLQYQRYELLVQLMQMNYTTYVTTATFLCSDNTNRQNNNNNNKMQRYELPNVQDVPYISAATTTKTTNDDSLVPDCTLNDMEYKDSILDQILLYIFRSLVTKHTNGVTSSLPGIRGLLEQGRTFMVQEKDHPPEVQHIMVQNTLRDLMTPILPPFYRIFMSGIIPKIQLPYKNITLHAEEKQYGPWFYAPFLTSYITPTFFKFLVGPSYPNRHRYTGSYGGLLVTKCKFLQESNCKGLCLHQCKLPAQNFFQTTLGLSLNVIPNFVTQECQWSFNEIPISPVSEDPSFPSGCIRGCTSRMIMKDEDDTTRSSSSICN